MELNNADLQHLGIDLDEDYEDVEEENNFEDYNIDSDNDMFNFEFEINSAYDYAEGLTPDQI